VDICHDVLAGGLEVGQQRGTVRDALEVVDGEFQPDAVGDGVCRAAGDGDDDHCVLEGLAGEDVRGADVLPEQVLDRASRGQALEHLGFGVGRVGGGAGERHAHGLDGGGHGVGRVHAAAGALAVAGVADDVEALVLCDLAGDELAVRLEGGDDVDLLVLERLGAAGLDGAAVDHQGRAVDAAHGHDDAGHVLVAAGDGDVGVVPLAAHDRLDRVGDDLARLQRVAHALGAHGDAVADADGVELHAQQARALHALLDLVVEVHQVHVARVARVPYGADAHLRLVHVRLAHPRRVQHGLRRALRLGLRDVLGHRIELIVGPGAARRGAGEGAGDVGIGVPLRARRPPGAGEGSSKAGERHCYGGLQTGAGAAGALETERPPASTLLTLFRANDACRLRSSLRRGDVRVSMGASGSLSANRRRGDHQLHTSRHTARVTFVKLWQSARAVSAGSRFYTLVRYASSKC
jgi:hypothetical protein